GDGRDELDGLAGERRRDRRGHDVGGGDLADRLAEGARGGGREVRGARVRGGDGVQPDTEGRGDVRDRDPAAEGGGVPEGRSVDEELHGARRRAGARRHRGDGGGEADGLAERRWVDRRGHRGRRPRRV